MWPQEEVYYEESLVVSDDDFDSDTQDRLYAQLHHEPNPLFSSEQVYLEERNESELNSVETVNGVESVQQSEIADCKKLQSYQHQAPSFVSVTFEKSTKAKRKCHEEIATDSVYHAKKLKRASNDELDGKSFSKAKRFVSFSAEDIRFRDIDESNSSVEDCVLIPLDTDVTINVNKIERFDADVGGEDFSVSKLQRSMSDANWKIEFKDQYGHVKEKCRYYRKKMEFVMCHNCKERGHLSKHCTKPRKLPQCNLCGTEGHTGAKCYRLICAICFQDGHSANRCRMKKRNVDNMKCERCSYIGHYAENCPDIWRRYHLTTQEGELIRGGGKANKNVQCYNCAGPGHFGFDCRRPRMKRYGKPSSSFIISYEYHYNCNQKKPATSKGAHKHWTYAVVKDEAIKPKDNKNDCKVKPTCNTSAYENFPRNVDNNNDKDELQDILKVHKYPGGRKKWKKNKKPKIPKNDETVVKQRPPKKKRKSKSSV